MKTITFIAMATLAIACNSDDDPGYGAPKQPGASSSAAASTGAGAAGGGGSGGASSSSSSSSAGGAGGDCDEFDPLQPECCEKSDLCKDTACEVDKWLCGGSCEGKPNPDDPVPCGIAGECVGKVCVEPGRGGAGGQGGSGGA